MNVRVDWKPDLWCNEHKAYQGRKPTAIGNVPIPIAARYTFRQEGRILLKNSQSWNSKNSSKSTPLRILSEDCRERFQRDATGLGTPLLPNPLPKYYRCAVRGNKFEFWPKSEFFNRIGPLLPLTLPWPCCDAARQTCRSLHLQNQERGEFTQCGTMPDGV